MKLRFETFAGEIRVNLDQCKKCKTHACVSACPVNVLKLDERGFPALSKEPSEVKKGGCIECLACEQECLSKGSHALEILLPLLGYE
jgi:NAD-dependent dihydropyrimidine dehydrogenase PreA subunit